MQKKIAEMSTYEKCKYIKKMIVDCTAEIIVYQNMPAATALKKIKQLPLSISRLEGGETMFNIQPKDMTKAQLNVLEFTPWQHDHDLHLIPLWLFPFLANNVETIATDGKQLNKKSDINTNNQSSFIEYGVIPSK